MQIVCPCYKKTKKQIRRSILYHIVGDRGIQKSIGDKRAYKKDYSRGE